MSRGALAQQSVSALGLASTQSCGIEAHLQCFSLFHLKIPCQLECMTPRFWDPTSRKGAGLRLTRTPSACNAGWFRPNS